MMLFVGQWGHALAAVAFAAIACWIAIGRRRGAPLALACALAAIAGWAAVASGTGIEALPARIGETLRNLALLLFLHVLLRREADDERRRYMGLLLGALALVGGLQLLIDLIPALDDGALREVVFVSATALRMSFAIGALLLVHNLYTAASAADRAAIRPTMIALGALWAYDLNLHTVAWLTDRAPDLLLAARGGFVALLAPLFALAGRRRADLEVRLSRTVAFQSIALVAFGCYFIAMVVATRAIALLGPAYAPIIQLALVVAVSAATLLLLPSRRLRAWLRVKIAKHIFKHRYDYRAEWIRFNRTLGESGASASIEERAIRAIADITESPGGALLESEAGDALVETAQWGWPEAGFGRQVNQSAFCDFLAETGHIVEIDAPAPEGPRAAAPRWLASNSRAWALVPLIHNERLIGAVALARPLVDRTLDWEDFDLLRIAGRQVASHLAEARGQEALNEARRFDEFNRRFAFIIHDIKNLVSQLSLVARNAERHADNPAFRADMIATLRDSVGKMNDLLARLSRHHRGRSEEPRATSMRAIAGAVVAQKSPQHPVELEAGSDVAGIADPVRLETVLAHLVQNAIDASPAGSTVWVGVRREGLLAAVSVLDHGVGMTAEFIRSGLFKPFASSKQGGFGIGAFEARTLVAEMNGRLEVESRPGEGSRFTVWLPIAGADAIALFADPPPAQLERKIA